MAQARWGDREYPPHFQFLLDDKRIHVLSYRSDSGLGEASDREQVMIGDHAVWSKTVEFYRRHMSPDHPLMKVVDAYLAGLP